MKYTLGKYLIIITLKLNTLSQHSTNFLPFYEIKITLLIEKQLCNSFNNPKITTNFHNTLNNDLCMKI